VWESSIHQDVDRKSNPTGQRSDKDVTAKVALISPFAVGLGAHPRVLAPA
jgi:hypothetical protein